MFLGTMDRIGRFGWWIYVVVLMLGFVASGYGPPPASTAVLAWSTMAIWLFVPWAWWIDKHRTLIVSKIRGSPISYTDRSDAR